MPKRTLYKPQFHPKLARALAFDGLKEDEIYVQMDISEKTFYNWKRDYPEFKRALEEGKAPVDHDVEQALLKRALGYDYDEISIETDARGNIKRVNTTKKQVPPDFQSMRFWLMNRKRDKWTEKPIQVNQNNLLVSPRMKMLIDDEEGRELVKGLYRRSAMLEREDNVIDVKQVKQIRDARINKE